MNKTANKKFDKLMERSQEQIYRKLYNEALKTLSEAGSLLQIEKDNSAEAWAWVYDGRRYALYEAGRIDEAIHECETALKHLSQNGTWAYLSEHNHVRATLRACHNMLAWYLAENAKTEEECLGALKHITTCLETISPIEDKETLVPFLDTHAVVLLKLIKLSENEHTYRTPFYIALAEIVKRNPQALDGNEELKSEFESEGFKAHLAKDPVLKLCNAPENESFEQMLERFAEAVLLAAKRNEDYAEFFKLKFAEKIPESRLKKIESDLGFELPTELRELAKTRGPFTAGTFNDLCVMGGWNDNGHPTGLVEYIDYVWGGRPEFEEFYKEKEVRFLNENYFAIGTRYQDDNVHEYIYFDKNGKFGSIVFDQDYFEAFQDEVEPMFEKSTARETLKQVLSRQFTELIKEKVLNQYLE